jgi:hypothetical protein
MTKSSAMTWKVARANVETQGLPECPEDMNEAQNANLVFFNNCHVCKYLLGIRLAHTFSFSIVLHRKPSGRFFGTRGSEHAINA